MITKRKLRNEIDELRSYNKHLYNRISILFNRIKLLENPPKYKVGEVIGKYTITEYLGMGNINLLSSNKQKEYRAIKKCKIVTVSESKLDKIKVK